MTNEDKSVGQELAEELASFVYFGRSDGEVRSSVEDNSASTERAAGEASRYAHGSGIGEALRARVVRMKEDAREQAKRFENLGHWTASNDYVSQVFAFCRVLETIDALEANAATLTHEPGRRSS